MWLVLGHRVRTELVAGGAERVERCTGCAEHSLFREHRRVMTATAYTIPVFHYASQMLMVCTRCGEQVVAARSGPRGVDQQGTVAGAVADGASRAKSTLSQAGLTQSLRDSLPTEGLSARAAKLAGGLKATVDRATDVVRYELDRDAHDTPQRARWLQLLERFERVEPDPRARLRSWRRARKAEGRPVRGLLAIEIPSDDERETLEALILGERPTP